MRNLGSAGSSTEIALLSIAHDSFLSAKVANGLLFLNGKGDSFLEAEASQGAFQKLLSEKLIHVVSVDNPETPSLAALQLTTAGLTRLVRTQRELSNGKRHQPGEVLTRSTTVERHGAWDVLEAEIVGPNADDNLGGVSYALHPPVEDTQEFAEAICDCPYDGYLALPGLISFPAENRLLESLESYLAENPLRILVIDRIQIKSRFLGGSAGRLALSYLMLHGECKTASVVSPFPLNYSLSTSDMGYLEGLSRLKRFYESMGFISFHPEQTIMMSIS